jgi:membrane associated rhomboid family serine protease
MCRTPVCEACSVSVTAHHWVCTACITKISLENPPSTDQADQEAVSWQWQYAPLTIATCLLLTGIYLLGAAPVWVYSRPDFLSWTSLDSLAVLHHQEYWRIVSGQLVHADFTHLGANTLSLLLFGGLLESRLGWRSLLGVLGISMAGTAAATLWGGVPQSVGSSGMAYGLQLAFMVLSVKQVINHHPQHIGQAIRSLMGYLLLMVVLNLWASDNINVWGHAGGAIAGGLYALFWVTNNATRDTLN